MTKNKKIKAFIVGGIVIAAALVTIAVSIFISCEKFGTPDFLSSFTAVIGIACGNNDITAIDDGSILITSTENHTDRVARFLESKGARYDKENSFGARMCFIKDNERFYYSVKVNSFFAVYRLL